MAVNPYMLSPYREINAENKSPSKACINANFPLMNDCMLLKKLCNDWKILKMARTDLLTFAEIILANKIHKNQKTKLTTTNSTTPLPKQTKDPLWKPKRTYCKN